MRRAGQGRAKGCAHLGFCGWLCAVAWAGQHLMLSLLERKQRCFEGLVCTPAVPALPSRKAQQLSKLVQDSTTPHHPSHSPIFFLPAQSRLALALKSTTWLRPWLDWAFARLWQRQAAPWVSQERAGSAGDILPRPRPFTTRLLYASTPRTLLPIMQSAASCTGLPCAVTLQSQEPRLRLRQARRHRPARGRCRRLPASHGRRSSSSLARCCWPRSSPSWPVKPSITCSAACTWCSS